jgi:hypothetical protein
MSRSLPLAFSAGASAGELSSVSWTRGVVYPIK